MSDYKEIISIEVDHRRAVADVAILHKRLKSDLERATASVAAAVNEPIRNIMRVQKAARDVVKLLYGDIIAINKDARRKILADEKAAQRDMESTVVAGLKRVANARKQAAQEDAAVRKDIQVRMRRDEMQFSSQGEAQIIGGLNKIRSARASEAAEHRKAAAEKIRSINREVAANERLHKQIHDRIALLRREAQAAHVRARTQGHIARAGNASMMERATLGQGLRIGAAGAAAGGQWRLAASIYAMERLANITGHADKSLSGVARTMGVVRLAGAGVAVGVVAIGAAIGGMMMHGNKLNVALADMSTLMGIATRSAENLAESIRGLAAEANVLSVAYNKPIEDIVAGFKTALSAGIQEDELGAFTNIATELAVALNIPLRDSLQMLTVFKTAYKLSIDEVGDVAHKIFTMVDVSQMEANEFANNVGRVIPIASAAGVALDDLFATLGTVSRIGMSASMSVTSVTQMIQKLASPTDDAKVALDAMGIAYGDAAFAAKNLVEIIEEIEQKTQGKGLETLSELFTEERARRGIAANLQLITLLRDMRDNEIAQAAERETASRAAEQQMKLFSVNMSKIGMAISNTAKIMGGELLNAANQIFFDGGALGPQTLLPVIEFFGELFRQIARIGTGLMALGKAAYNLVRVVMEANNLWKLASEGTGDLQAAVDDLSGVWGNYKEAIWNIDDAHAKMIDAMKAGLKEAAVEVDHLLEAQRELEKQLRLEKASDTALKDAVIGTALGMEVSNDDAIKKFDEQLSKTFDTIAARIKERSPELYDKLRKAMESGSGKNFAVDMIRLYSPENASDIVMLEQLAATRGAAFARASMTGVQKWFDENKNIKNPLVNFFGGDASALETIGNLGKAAMDKFNDATKDGFEKSHKDRLTKARSILKDAEDIYKKDLEAYEKAEEKKLKIAERTAKKIADTQAKFIGITEAFMSKIAEVQSAGMSDRAKGRNARKERANTKGRVDDYISGGGRDVDAIDGMMKKYLEAFDVEFEGARNKKSGKWVKELADIIAYINSISEAFEQEQIAEGEKLKGKASVPKPSAMAAVQEAMKKNNKEEITAIEQRLVNVNINADIQDPKARTKLFNDIAVHIQQEVKRGRLDLRDPQGSYE